MKAAWTLYSILLAISIASPAGADDSFNVGDKVTVRYRDESSLGEVVMSSRSTQQLIVRVESIVGGNSGLVLIVGDGSGYSLATSGERISIRPSNIGAPRERNPLTCGTLEDENPPTSHAPRQTVAGCQD